MMKVCEATSTVESGSAAKVADLASTLCSRASAMTPGELQALKRLFGVAVSGLYAPAGMPTDARRLAAVRAIQDMLFRLRATDDTVPDDGVLWCGRPAFMTPHVLSALQERASTVAERAIPNGKHRFIECPSVTELLPSFRDFLHGVSPGLAPTGKANLQYYTQPGEGVEAHVDIEDFLLSGIMVVKHEYEQRRESELWVFPRGAEPKALPLEPGHLVLLYASTVVHQRTPVTLGEQVTTLSIGISRSESGGFKTAT